MNSDLFLVARDIREYLEENPNNHLIFIRAQSYSILQAAMTLTGMDMRELSAEHLNFSLQMSKITNDISSFYLAEAMYEYNRYVNDNAIELLERSVQLDCLMFAITLFQIQSSTEYPTVNQAKDAVKIARLMYDTFQ